MATKKRTVKKTQVVEVEQKTDDAPILKVNHTHAGVDYEAGTLLSDLNPSDATIEFLKARDII